VGRLGAAIILLLLLAGIPPVTAHPSQSTGEGPSYVIPSRWLQPGASGLLIIPSNRASFEVTVSVVLQSGGREDNYTYSFTLQAEGLPWPYERGYYAYVLPGFPALNEFYTYKGQGVILTVETTVRVGYTFAGEPFETVVHWASNGTSSTPLAFLVADKGSPETLYLSPKGWVFPSGSTLRVYAFAVGLGRDPLASLLVGPSGNPAEYVMNRYEGWWATLGSAVDRINQWFSKLPDADERLTGRLPRAVYGGGVWVSEVGPYAPGSKVDYWVKVSGSNGVAYSPKGWAVSTVSGGRRVLIVDAAPVLYTVGVLNKDYEPPAGAPSRDYTAAKRIGDSLWTARLLQSHDFSGLARRYSIYVAYPGGEAASLLQHSTYQAVIVEPLPPPPRGTPWDWAKTIRQVIRGLEVQARKGAGIIAAGTAIGDLGGAYNYTLSDNGAMLRLLGLQQVLLLERAGYKPILSPLPSWNGTLRLTAEGYGLASEYTVVGGVDVPGVLVTVKGCRPRPPAGELEAPWSTLSTKDYPGGDWRSVAREAGSTLKTLGGAVEALASAQVSGRVLRVGKTLFPLDDTARLLASQAVPVLVSSDCLAGVYARDYTFRSVYFTFDPLSSGQGGQLLAWAVSWAMKPPRGNSSIDSLPASADLSALAGSLGIAGAPWNVTIATPGGSPLRITGSTVLAVFWGEASVNGTLIREARVYGGETLVVYARGNITVKAGGPSRLLAVAYAPSTLSPPHTSQTTSRTTTSTTTTSTKSKTTSGGLPATSTTPGPSGNRYFKLLEVALVVTLTLGLLAILAARRRGYKYI